LTGFKVRVYHRLTDYTGRETVTIQQPEKPELTPFQAKRNAIDLEATEPLDDSLARWQQSKLAAIMTAGSFDEINNLMTETGLTKAQSLVGRTLTIRNFQVRESAAQYRENSQLQKVAYADAVDPDTGEDFTIDGGGDMFVGGLIAMRDLYGFPFTGTLLGLTTGSGTVMHYWRFHNPGRPASA
jgi:hypothetical protein